MRVAILHYTAPPVPGGVESVIREHSRLLTEDGHQVTLVAGKGGPSARPRKRWSCEVVRLSLLAATNPRVRRIESRLAEGVVSADFVRCVEEISGLLSPVLASQDVVIAHNVLTLHFNQSLTAALASTAQTDATPLIAWTHDIAAVNPLYATELHPGYPWDLLRWPQPNTRYVCISRQRRSQLMGLWESEGSAREFHEPEVIEDGLNTAGAVRLSPFAARLEQRFELSRRDLVLILPVRLTRRKKVELAIEATAELATAGTDVVLLVTGPTAPHHPDRSSGYLAELKEQIARLRVSERVLFLADLMGQRLRAGDVHDLYGLADALLLPSASEGFGLPLLEAAVNRLPIVCSDLPVFREIAGDAALYFRPDSPAGEVASLILAATSSPVARLKSRVMRHYAWDAIYRRQIRPLLRRLLAGQ